jgi:hypothetical protein
MPLSRIDELNNIETRRRRRGNQSMPYEQWFGEMGLPEEKIQKRIALANDLDDVFEYLFVIYLALVRAGMEVNREELTVMVLWRYRDVLKANGIDYEVKYPGLLDISRDHAADIVDTTIRRGQEDPWWTSDDRARLITENEVNSIGDYEDFTDAIADGATQKTWCTMGDRRVREWHKEADGQTVGILDYFEVGGELMLYPHDASASPDNVVNCRCWAEYI